MNKTTYFAIGSVRGWCGHHHRTIAAAVECKMKDHGGCRSLPGNAYSDRSVMAGSQGVEPAIIAGQRLDCRGLDEWEQEQEEACYDY